MATKPAGKTAAPKAAAKAAAPKKAASKKAATSKSAPKKAATPASTAAHTKTVEREIEKADHQHQDPRGPAHQHNPAAQAHGSDPRKDTIKTRGVPRMNKI